MSRSPAAWALHSPRRFVAVLIASVAALVAMTSVGMHRSGSGADGPTDRTASVAAEQSVSASSPAPLAPPDEEDETIGPAARRTVQQFLSHYLTPTTREGLEQLRPLCTPDLWTGLKVAEPANMPVGPVRQIEKVADGAFTATFTITLPQTSLRVEVVTAPEGLRIASVEPEAP